MFAYIQYLHMFNMAFNNYFDKSPYLPPPVDVLLPEDDALVGDAGGEEVAPLARVFGPVASPRTRGNC